MRPLMIFTLILLPSLASAQQYCGKPRPPQCSTGYGTFSDESAFNLCKREMDGYRRDVEAYTRCLGQWVQKTAQEAESLRDDAAKIYQRHVEYWNCKARDPEGFCSAP